MKSLVFVCLIDERAVFIDESSLPPFTPLKPPSPTLHGTMPGPGCRVGCIGPVWGGPNNPSGLNPSIHHTTTYTLYFHSLSLPCLVLVLLLLVCNIPNELAPSEGVRRPRFAEGLPCPAKFDYVSL